MLPISRTQFQSHWQSTCDADLIPQSPKAGAWYENQMQFDRRPSADAHDLIDHATKHGWTAADLKYELVAAMHVAIDYKAPADCIETVMLLWRDGHIDKNDVIDILAGRWDDRTPMEHQISRHGGGSEAFFEALLSWLPADDQAQYCLLPDEIADICRVCSTCRPNVEAPYLKTLFTRIAGATELPFGVRQQILQQIARTVKPDAGCVAQMALGILDSTAQPGEVFALVEMLPLKQVKPEMAAHDSNSIDEGLKQMKHAQALLDAPAGKVVLSRRSVSAKAAARVSDLRLIRNAGDGRMLFSATGNIPTFTALSPHTRDMSDPSLFYYEIPIRDLKISGLLGARLK